MEELFLFPDYTFHSSDNKIHRPDFVMVLRDKIILLELVQPNNIDTTERIYDIKRVHGDKNIIFVRYSEIYLLLTTREQRDKKLSDLLPIIIDMILTGNVTIYI